MSRPLIALLTDFGLADPYVGVMKGVMKSICPKAEFIDITHEVRPQSVADAAFLLATSRIHFPDHTVFLCVVDPGVGSDRAALAVESATHRFVAPDNGLLSLAWRHLDDPEAHMIVNPAYRLAEVSATFHGRDIFAPAAAHLAAGVPIEGLGPPMPDIEHLAFARPHREGAATLIAAVVHIDHFGNLITNARQSDLPRSVSPTDLRITFGGHQIDGLKTSYSFVDAGCPIAHWGSSGYLELAVRDGNAAECFGLDIGAAVQVTWPTGSED
jgi:S-adenosyl-L-methionine hydrolase (adenosine-forming)